ncbi:hypothetical protein TanjilG_19912 [Lupinus angustifolius]|uniref:Uncharacterized protein n=1 Tax=Lupinus angustifolius TaxID=3871 RepID=A0A1J7G5E6_LUPAN|nr:hypothetical protein TanjilG_19912 [Lupinus angustifolius]
MAHNFEFLVDVFILPPAPNGLPSKRARFILMVDPTDLSEDETHVVSKISLIFEAPTLPSKAHALVIGDPRSGESIHLVKVQLNQTEEEMFRSKEVLQLVEVRATKAEEELFFSQWQLSIMANDLERETQTQVQTLMCENASQAAWANAQKQVLLAFLGIDLSLIVIKAYIEDELLL